MYPQLFGQSFLDQDYDEGYFQPQQELAMFGMPQGGLRAPLSPPTPTPPQTMPQAPIAPTGLPVQAQGMLPPPPEMTGMQRGLDTLYNTFQRASGGMLAPGASPWAAEHAQKLQNYQLMNQRMQKLQQSKQQEDPFYKFEQAVQRGYFQPREGESMDQAYRRFVQEQFKDPTESVYSEKMSDLTQLAGGDRNFATKLEADLLEVRETDDGRQFVYDKSTGAQTDLYTPQQVAQGKALIAQSETRATEDTKANSEFRAQAIQSLRDSANEEALLQSALDTSEMFLERFRAKDLKNATGAVSGFFANLGFGPEPLGDLSAQQVRTTLENLGITNLAPVTVREILMVNQMWADVSAGKKINEGRLENAIRNIQRALSDLEYERNRNLSELKRYGSEDDYNYYYDQYGTIDDIDTLLGRK